MIEAATIERSWWQRVGAFIGTWWQQIAITQAGIYLVASFGQGHGILPWQAAWGLALGMEGTYLKGLIDAGHVQGRGRGWATALIIGTYVTVISWGIAYILSLPSVGVIPAGDLGAGWGTFIAVIHVLPIAFTGACSAMLHRARASEEGVRAEARRRQVEAREREQQRRLDDEAAAERAERRTLQLEQAKKRGEIALWAEAQQAKAALKASQASQPSVTASPESVTAPAAPVTAPRDEPRSTASRSPRDVFKAAVVTAFRDDPQFDRTALAARHGWSRPAVNKLLDEARKDNLL